ncbi:MAG TPA: tetratricopeptide repeat protein, partial [Blastocatellia bacterium]|nr:tetratricopeptide repeat protein [Blastocatellia bacterium]
DLIDARGLSAGWIIEAAIQICDALVEAHLQNIIHRDIKPTNILITESGQVKLLDFGLAKSISRDEASSYGATSVESLTRSGTVVGTLSYMSPEQLSGEPLAEHTDIFSFGIVLYEMITGRLPFKGSNSYEVAAAILKDEALTISRLPHDLPADITRVVMRCLRKERSHRYSSFAEVKQDLVAIDREWSKSRGSVRTTVKLPQADQWRPESADQKSLSPTILVLPLEVITSSDEGSYLGVGLAHAVRTNLAKIGGLSVISKVAEAGRADQQGRGLKELARELGATIVLEGEVIRAEQTIHVMARLTDVATGRIIWGDQYSGDIKDFFSIQDHLCRGVARALEVNIPGDVREQIEHSGTRDIEAFELYSKGRALIERHDVSENIDSAIHLFEDAIRLDPEFALAQAGLCEAYWMKYFQVTRDNIWVERAITAGDRALVLDPRQAQAHISLGIIYNGTGRIDRAIQSFEQAARLQLTNDAAYRWLGRCFQRKGDLERAVECFTKAIEIRPGYWENYYFLGICYYLFSRYEDAAEQFRQLITIQPDSHHGYDKLGAIYILLGRYEDAVVMHKRALQVSPSFEAYSNLGTACFYLGRYGEALDSYRKAVEMNPRDDIMHTNLGDACLQMGDERAAQAQYEIACEILEERLSVERDQAELLGRLAVCRAKLNRNDDAQKIIERAVALEPNNTSLMYQKAVVLALTGCADSAISCL